MQQHSYLEFLEHDLTVLAVGATALSVFSVLGFLHERYVRERPRAIVSFCFFWGMFSAFGYPAVSDISAAWTTINAIVPLAVPAGVGVGLVVSRGREAVAHGNTAGARAAAVALLVATAGTGAVAAQTTYVNPQGPNNPLVQFAQPAGHMKPTLAEVREVSAANEGVDVMFYGEKFDNPNDLATEPELEVGYGGYQGWFDRLPLPWYLERYGANVSSTVTSEAIREHDPPVVILDQAKADNLAVDLREQGYTRTVHQGFQCCKPLVFYVQHNASS